MSNKHFAVLGDPVTQSLSPRIHKSAYAHLGLDWSYEAILVKSGQLSDFIESNSDFSGFSVTMPLKYEAAACSLAADESSRLTGVVNTLVPSATGIQGYNTDVFGLAQSIQHLHGIQKVVVVGSGATATSALLAVSSVFAGAKMLVMARNIERRQHLAQLFSADSSAILPENIEADLVIDTVPASTVQTSGVLLRTSYKIGDLASQRSIPGTEMLIWQALAQIRIFVNGSAESILPNEHDLLAQMRLAISAV